MKILFEKIPHINLSKWMWNYKLTEKSYLKRHSWIVPEQIWAWTVQEKISTPKKEWNHFLHFRYY
jgi:hypothetical protein